MTEHALVSAQNRNQEKPADKGTLQRQCACGQHTYSTGECPDCKSKSHILQRVSTNQAESITAPSIVKDVLNSPGQPLDPTTRRFMEPRFGQDFSKVRVHVDSRASQSARSVNARAYTLGPDIVFAAGEYNPGTHAGMKLLAHELTHVAQQGNGPVALSGKLKVNNPHDTYEVEADRVSDAVMRGQNIPSISPINSSIRLQRQEFEPLEDDVHTIVGNETLVDHGQNVIHFLGDFVTWNKWNYTSVRRVDGPCGQALSGAATESSGYVFSWGSTTTAGGKVAGGTGGKGPSASAEVSASVSESVGFSLSATESFGMNYACEARQNRKPVAVIRYNVNEYSGRYTDWHLFSGTDYEFHAHQRQVLGYDCNYEACS